jgi:hypothetical protein
MRAGETEAGLDRRRAFHARQSRSHQKIQRLANNIAGRSHFYAAICACALSGTFKTLIDRAFLGTFEMKPFLARRSVIRCAVLASHPFPKYRAISRRDGGIHAEEMNFSVFSCCSVSELLIETSEITLQTIYWLASVVATQLQEEKKVIHIFFA